MRLSLIAALLMLAFRCEAAQPFQPCPYFTSGWAVQGPPPITSIGYDQDTQLLYVIFNYSQGTAYSNVPISIIQTLSRSSSLYATWRVAVQNVYHPLLLSETYNCPITQENGAYIWTQ
jgi:hypothetical protein